MDKLVLVVGPTLTTTEYWYDPDGNRVAKNTNGVRTDFVVDRNREHSQVLVEADNTGQKSYTLGQDLISQRLAGSTQYYHYDRLDSVRQLTDATGSILTSYNYDSYGRLLKQTSSAINPYLFTGEYFDSDVNQYYLRARLYDPETGRFTQMDTWPGNKEHPITLNKYLYANADPVNNTDPSGKTTATLVSYSLVTAITATLARTAIYTLGGMVAGAIVNSEVDWMLAEVPLVFAVAASSAVSSAQAVQRQAEYRQAKDFCDSSPRPGGNQCSTLSKKIDHAKRCIELYEAWDTKWLQGRHAQKIADWKQRLENLKGEHHRKCI